MDDLVDNSGRGLLLFDADCGFCTRSAGWAEGPVLRSTLTKLAFQRAPLSELGLDPAKCAEALHVIGHDGRVHVGSDAVAEVLLTSRLPWRPLGWLLRLPGLRRLAQFGYAIVARNRHRLPGGTAACSLDGR